MEYTFSERNFIRHMLRTKLGDLSGMSFQRFFQDLMCARYPDFLDVRPHGSLGDFGSDGLSLHGGKLYACYGQETANPAAIRPKFRSDLESALRKWSGQFETFVFVHNDLRGVRPEVGRMLTDARDAHADVMFAQYGFRQFLTDMVRLERTQVEDLLGCQFPTVDEVYRVGLEDLEPLLTHLAQQRRAAGPRANASEVPPYKLEYNELEPEDYQDLVEAFKYTYLVEEYYHQRVDVLERDEVAEGFRSYYGDLRRECDDAGEIIFRLKEYVAGTARRRPQEENAASVVLAYFVETCDVLEEPPQGWRGTAAGSEAW